MQESVLKIRYFERELSNAFEKLTLFLLSNTVLFNGLDYEKQQGPGTSKELARLQNNLRKIPLMMYYLTKFDDVI